MKERPILFNTEMVKAILGGMKTQTRRLIKPQPQSRLAYCYAGTDCGTWGYPTATAHEFWGADFELPRGLSEGEKQRRWKPPCEAGDVLWVRETWAKDVGRYMYRANCSDTEKFYMNGRETKVVWRPSIHMPREAARLFLRVKNVRIERLHDMSAKDSLEEGVKLHLNGIVNGEDPLLPFAELWNRTINKRDFSKFCWSANPWVWVIEFERMEKI